jgi:hypothetical protein
MSNTDPIKNRELTYIPEQQVVPAPHVAPAGLLR